MAYSAAGWTFPEVTDDTVQRYRENYSIPYQVVVTKQMVQKHMELEYELKNVLLESSPEIRAEAWVDSYDRLYRELPWLAETSSVEARSLDVQFGHLLKLIPPGSRIIEIGSGAGRLAQYLNENGRPCVATEVTAERGIREQSNTTWHRTDGVHLAEYEPESTYDVVLSMQVIEHLHPSDIVTHFEGAYALLRPNGSYVLTTPHNFFGPADLSRVFCLDRPHFMHLKEYTHRELGAAAREGGFRSISAVYIPPASVRKRLPFVLNSRWLYGHLSTVERLQQKRHLPNPVLRALLFHGDVFLIAKK